jgi:hypothetical protein
LSIDWKSHPFDEQINLISMWLESKTIFMHGKVVIKELSNIHSLAENYDGDDDELHEIKQFKY